MFGHKIRRKMERKKEENTQTTPPRSPGGSKTEKMMACDQGKQNLNMGGCGKNFMDFW